MATEQLPTRFTRICGIDPGLGRTGYGVVELDHGEPRIIEAGVLRPGLSDETLAARLAALADGLDELLVEHAPEALAVEQLYAHYKHPRTAILMGHARGVILMTAAKRNVPVLDLPATTVKRYLTGSGHASKSQMQKMIAHVLQLRVPPQPPDVADALAIALCALHRPYGVRSLRDRGASERFRRLEGAREAAKHQ
jgi:crossover junction endodeoxyribonuclease RuvC